MSSNRSPYKKAKIVNQAWVPYINIKLLTPHQLYKMTGLIETNHVQYGRGQQAHVENKAGEKFRTQLPGKYLQNFNSEDITSIKTDIMNGKCPYLVFREVMPDNSYRIDLIEKAAEYDEKFISGTVVPELEKSVESINMDDEDKDKEKEKDEEKVDDVEVPKNTTKIVKVEGEKPCEKESE